MAEKILLDDVIRKLAASGDFTHLSLSPRAGKGPGGVSWFASYSPASAFGHGIGEDVDPVEAVILAVEDARKRKIASGLRDGKPAPKITGRVFGGKRMPVEEGAPPVADETPDFSVPA